MDKCVLPLLAAGALALSSLGPLQFINAPEWVVWSARAAAVGFLAFGIHQTHKA